MLEVLPERKRHRSGGERFQTKPRAVIRGAGLARHIDAAIIGLLPAFLLCRRTGLAQIGIESGAALTPRFKIPLQIRGIGQLSNLRLD